MARASERALSSSKPFKLLSNKDSGKIVNGRVNGPKCTQRCVHFGPRFGGLTKATFKAKFAFRNIVNSSMFASLCSNRGWHHAVDRAGMA